MSHLCLRWLYVFTTFGYKHIYGSRSYQKRQIMYVLNVSNENPLKVSLNDEQSRLINTLLQKV